MRTVQKRFEALLAEGATGSHAKRARRALCCLKRRHALWTFVYFEGVEPTNNGAEQVVRHGVIMRKIIWNAFRGRQSLRQNGC
jgi:hypothetical protein